MNVGPGPGGDQWPGWQQGVSGKITWTPSFRVKTRAKLEKRQSGAQGAPGGQESQEGWPVSLCHTDFLNVVQNGPVL